MKFRDPWIDPRVEQVRPDDFIAYLNRQGWSEEKSRLAPMRYFHAPQGCRVYVPTIADDDRFVLSMIEAVTQVALCEDRFAGDILTDLLGSSASPQPPETAPQPSQEKSAVVAAPAGR